MILLLELKQVIDLQRDKFTRLSNYGDSFKLEPTDKEGVFKMIGNKEEEVPEELVNINDELESLDDLDNPFQL